MAEFSTFFSFHKKYALKDQSLLNYKISRTLQTRGKTSMKVKIRIYASKVIKMLLIILDL